MSNSEECQSTTSEALKRSNDAFVDQINKPSLERLSENQTVELVENQYVNQSKHFHEKFSISAMKEEIMDSEVSSITSREEPDLESCNSFNENEENEEKSPDITAFSGRISTDFESAALSPCFPLIRDKEEPEKRNNELISNDDRESKSELSNIHNDLEDLTTLTNKIVEEDTEKEESYGGSCDRGISIKGRSVSVQNDESLEDFKPEDKLEFDKCKDNIVSSSLDKNNDFISKEESSASSPIKDICDSSRELVKEPEVDAVPSEKEIELRRETNDSDYDEDVDGSDEALANISFASSVEEDDDNEPAPYTEITENIYLVDKKKTRLNKEIRRIRCDCVYEPDEPDFVGCGINCLNRLLMIECGNKCSCGEFCTNKSFQKGCVYDLEVFKAGKKGLGVRTKEKIDSGVFIIEYCGEVVNYKEFMDRTDVYDQEKRKHYYFMLLKGDEVIDATKSGSISRFINHSCDPNCVTQKWTVNGFLRVGFFSLREIKAGEELSFDYQYQRYGEKAQRCFCGSENCRGVIGGKQMVLKPSGSNGETSKRRLKKKSIDYATDYKLEDDLNELLGEQNKISTSKQALELTRLMVKTETIADRCTLLKIVRDQSESKALKAFIRYKGLSLLWSWMVDTPSKDLNFRAEVLSTLKMLPIPNRNHLVDSKILPLVEKWSRFHDSPDSTRSDEDGSSSENEAAAAARKEETKKEDEGNGDGVDVSKEGKNKGTSEAKSSSTDEESDNSDKNEEVGSLANELLDCWKGLREVYKIPKKAQLTPEQSKQSIDASASPVEERRSGKRKLEGNTLFSPNKRPFGIPQVNSPLRPLMQETPNPPAFVASSAQPTASSSQPTVTSSSSSSNVVQSTQGIVGTSTDDVPAKPDLIQRILEISEPRNVEAKSFNDESKLTRGHNRIGRGINSLSWRSNPKFHDDFHNSPERNMRGGRGPRAKQRMRGRGNFSPFGHQQHQYNDMNKHEWSSNTYGSKEMEPLHARDVKDNNNFGNQNVRLFPDSNRLPSPYNYQAFSQTQRERPKDPELSSDNVRFERHGNLLAERHDGNTTRFDALRLPSQNLNRFPKPGQEWQQSQGQTYTSYSGGVQPVFNPAGLQSNVVPPPRMPSSHTPQQFGTAPVPSNQAIPPQNVPMPNWNQNWTMQPQQNFPPPNLPAQNLTTSQSMANPIVGQMPNPISNPIGLGVPPFPLNLDHRLPGQPNIPNLPQQQQQCPLFDGSQQPPFTKLQTEVINADTPTDPNQSTPATIIKHLHELAQQSKLVTEQQQKKQYEEVQLQQQQMEQKEEYVNKTPETVTNSGIVSVTPVKGQRTENIVASTDFHASTKKVLSLPPDWKTATDPEGKVYYYHVITRKTQWEVPKWESEDVLTSKNQRKISGGYSGPRTPPVSPPHSPISPARETFPQRAPAISDPSVSTTRISHSASGSSEQLTPKQQKMRDQFKNKLSAVVVNCLNPYQKVDCKQARIAKVEDFKFLARKLTHGLMMKELGRVKSDEELECNDSVKIKVKEYIRNYMKKFGQFYIRS